MTNLVRGVVSVVVLGLAACGGAEAESSAAPGTEALVSSESQLTCTSCGGPRYSDYQAGFGYTCPESWQVARSTLAMNMAYACPAGTCNVVWTTQRCMPVGPSRDDGFEAALSVAYSCCQ